VRGTSDHVTLLSDMVTAKMEEKGFSIKDLAIKLDLTYEHARRIVRGEGVPSRFVLRPLCELLGMPYKEAERVATEDKIRIKYGTVPMEMAGKKPSLEPIERVWDLLSPEQQQDATTMIQGWARRTRAAS
jgi:transcriptional regulator with XRE-family HTH domain